LKIVLALILLVPLQIAFGLDHEHKKFTTVLSKHLKIINSQSLVNYKNLKEKPNLLNSYLNDISAVTKQEYSKFNSDQQLAFLINAYNAYTLKLIINNYPIKSIRKIGGLFTKPWSIDFFTLFGEKFTLDKIEHQTIRKNFKEAKIHFAVNCASISCPSLYKEAFVATKLQDQLTKATLFFLNNKSKNTIATGTNTITISKVFDWYEGDFEKHEKSVIHFISKILQVNISEKSEIDYHDYDWNLNEWKD
jgi:hypothetical protein